MQKVHTLFFSALFSLASLKGQEAGISDTLSRLNALFSSCNTSTPGGVLTVMRGNEILYNKAGGMADLEHHIANTTETVFEAGSVSKQFTASAVLILAAEGKLALEDDVRKYIPELPDYDTVIRIRHLLVHTSGLKDWGSIASLGGWPRTTRVYTQELAREIIFRQKTLNFPPGSAYSYSNSNYTLLATLVERISGQSLADFTRERIFKPAGMNRTQWRDDFRRIVPDRAIAYEKKNDAYVQTMPFEDTHGHAALLTTTADLLRWLRHWSEGKFGEELTELRERQGILNDGSTIRYARGAVVIDTVAGAREVSHSGATAGYRAWLAYYPEQQLSVAYLGNDGSVSPVSAIGQRVAEIFFGKAPAAPKTSASPARPVFDSIIAPQIYTGRYYSEEAGAWIDIRTKGRELEISWHPSSSYLLQATAPDSFRIVKRNVTIRFTRNRKNKITGFAASVERGANVQFEKLR